MWFASRTINTPLTFLMDLIVSDAAPSSLMDSTTSPKVKTMEGEGVGAHSLAYSISGVEVRAGTPGWD
jgi:hypothetical protein